jgi:hypothetical protein
MTNKGLKEVAKIIAMVVGKEMKVDSMENLTNAIYTGLFVVTQTDTDPKIKSLFKGLVTKMSKDINPKLTKSFKKFLKEVPVISEVKMGGQNPSPKVN